MAACTQVAAGRRVTVDKARFSTTASGVRELADWLADREVELVVMEATGVYWKPVFYGLEGLFAEVWLVTPAQIVGETTGGAMGKRSRSARVRATAIELRAAKQSRGQVEREAKRYKRLHDANIKALGDHGTQGDGKAAR